MMNADLDCLHLTIKSSSDLEQEFAQRNRTLEQTRNGIMAMSQFWGITGYTVENYEITLKIND